MSSPRPGLVRQLADDFDFIDHCPRLSSERLARWERRLAAVSEHVERQQLATHLIALAIELQTAVRAQSELAVTQLARLAAVLLGGDAPVKAQLEQAAREQQARVSVTGPVSAAPMTSSAGPTVGLLELLVQKGR